VELARSVVERTWLTVEVTRQQRALAREAEAMERVLENITDGFYALDAEWRFTHVNAQAERMLSRAQGGLLGLGIWEEFPEGVGTRPYVEYRRAVAEQVPVAFEEFYVPLATWFEVRAYLSSDSLSVFFQDVSERKAREGERKRIAERQTNIATQLQAALQPPLPQAVAGLKLAKYYEAALAEAGVGGDFYDCFPVEKGCTVLAVGDLAGKGLGAAAQVATVRNMLRAFLYSKPTLAEAVTDLNRVLALNGLLSDFATLWVGCYDAAAGELAYVNMGQEPALLRRAKTGAVEQLLPTGPVLGADENATYQERTVVLLPGDALVVFSDGVTECGPSRREMLGIEGVTALLETPFAPEETQSAARMAEAVTLRLVEGVDAASRGGVPKDDLCILVAVADSASPGPDSGRLGENVRDRNHTSGAQEWV